MIPSIWKSGAGLMTIKNLLFDAQKAQRTLKPTLVPTGIKAYMQTDEFLQLAIVQAIR